MSSTATQFHTVTGLPGETRKIAFLKTAGEKSSAPGLVWFNGFNSVMTSTKASALAERANETGQQLLRFDYSGHGLSEGKFTDGTISAWLEESLSILRAQAKGPQILIGSSMGGWLVLLILRALARAEAGSEGLPPLCGAVLIAPAWDMTEELIWKNLSQDARDALKKQGFWNRPSEYDDGPYPITARLIEDGRNHLIGDTSFNPQLPVRILQGMQDPDVPWRHADRLTRLLCSDDLMLHLIHDGDHRLSRPRDIERLLRTIEALEGN